MSKPYTEEEFSTQINTDKSWRLKEISDLKTAVRRADNNLQRVLLRALVTVCYAHWEGYVRFAARKYLEHVALRKFQYSDLNRQFLKNYFLPQLGGLANSHSSIEERCTLIDEIFNSQGRRYSRVNDDIVNTKANLNFEVFSDICRVCSVPIQPFVEKATFLNVLLLKRRNAIAHGEDAFLSIIDLDELTSETVNVMRIFGDALENHVYLKKYRSA